MPARPELLARVSGPGKERRLSQKVQKVIRRLADPDLEDPLAQLLCVLHVVEQESGLRVLLAHRSPGKGEVVRGHGSSVAPASVGTEVEPIGRPVTGDGEAVGEIGNDLELASDSDEAAKEVSAHLPADVGVGVPGHERMWVEMARLEALGRLESERRRWTVGEGFPIGVPGAIEVEGEMVRERDPE